MKLYLVRHGESQINLQGKRDGKLHQGQLDSPLSENGKKQAELLAQRLSEEPFKTIYTSDLKRAANTAHAIQKFHPVVQLIEDMRLRERSKGKFEGKPKATHDEDALPGNPYTRKPPGGESYQEQKDRVEAVFEEILEKDENTLIVAHTNVLKIIIHRILALPEEEVFKRGFEIGNTGVFIFDITEEGIKTLLYNCTGHLEDNPYY